MAVLIGMSSEVKGRIFNVDRDTVAIGRNLTNHIVLDHPTVSGRHCQIVHEGKRFVLSDLNSTNGTRVNGREITECALRPKDLVQIGALEFMFDAEDVETEPTPPSIPTHVEVATEPPSLPPTFGTISPFGTRRRDNLLLWYMLIGIIGLLALIAAAVVFYLLFLPRHP